MVYVLPTVKEVERWVNEVVIHSNHIEYYLNNLGLGDNDPERPHDLVGRGNKLEWKTVKGLTLTYRGCDVDFEKYILPSIEFHRQQYHHRMWNKYNTEANEEDRFVGAVDAACSLLENRVYSGGKKQEDLGRKHGWGELKEKLIGDNPKYKSGPANFIVPRMQALPRPKLGLIKDIFDFPNIGIREDIYLKMRERIDEGVKNLRKHVDIFN
jgi:hypothetical protein